MQKINDTMEKLYKFSAPVSPQLNAVLYLFYKVLRMRQWQLEKSREEVLDHVYELKKKKEYCW